MSTTSARFEPITRYIPCMHNTPDSQLHVDRLYEIRNVKDKKKRKLGSELAETKAGERKKQNFPNYKPLSVVAPTGTP